MSPPLEDDSIPLVSDLVVIPKPTPSRVLVLINTVVL
jgi:hypothetical protein